MKISDVYDELKSFGICKSENEFSKNYLCKDRNYLSVLRCRGSTPSIAVLMVLSTNLQQRSQVLKNSKHKSVREVGARLTEIHKMIISGVLEECATRNH